MNSEDRILVLVSSLGIIIFVVITAVILRSVSLQSTCLRAGYPESSVSWDFSGYCVKRVDQTDVVVPVGEVKR